jgi:hypothetical protein
MDALLGKELLVIIPGDQLKWNPHKGIDLFALGELERRSPPRPPLGPWILEDSHSQVASLHLTKRILSCVDAPNDQFLRILASLLKRGNRSDGHFVIVGGDARLLH